MIVMKTQVYDIELELFSMKSVKKRKLTIWNFSRN